MCTKIYYNTHVMTSTAKKRGNISFKIKYISPLILCKLYIIKAFFRSCRARVIEHLGKHSNVAGASTSFTLFPPLTERQLTKNPQRQSVFETKFSATIFALDCQLNHSITSSKQFCNCLP